jgi:hypothetical protein
MFKCLVVISALGGFCALNAYALGKYGVYESEHGYSEEDRMAMNNLIDGVLAETKPVSEMTPEEQIVYLYGEDGGAL